MNDPLSRKLFQPREAREKLRSMGGIMSSSPQLASTVQKFQAGGPIRAAELQTPVGRSTNIGGQTYTLLPSGIVINARTGEPVAAPEALAVQRKLQVFPETDPIQVGSGVNPSFAYDEQMRGRGIGTVPSRLPAYGADSFMDALVPGTDAPIAPEARSIGGLRPAPGMGLRGAFPAPAAAAAETVASEAPVEPGGFFEMLGRSSGAARQTPNEMDELDETARQSAEEAAALRAEQGITRSRGPAQAEPRVVEAPETRDDVDTAPPPPPIFDPKQPETFETSYEQMLERLQGVTGKKDVDTRKKAMANLAMIGLAIASGQSPNALTNIAQGALSGMQAIRAEEASREEQEQAIKAAAFKATVDMQAGRAEADARAEEGRLERENRLAVAGLRSPQGGGRNFRAIEEFAQNIYNDSLKAAIGMPPPSDMMDGESADAYAQKKAAAARQYMLSQFPGSYGGVATGGAPVGGADDLTDEERDLLGG